VRALCEPVQSKCTWKFHKRHFLRKFTGKYQLKHLDQARSVDTLFAEQTRALQVFREKLTSSEVPAFGRSSVHCCVGTLPIGRTQSCCSGHGLWYVYPYFHCFDQFKSTLLLTCKPLATKTLVRKTTCGKQTFEPLQHAVDFEFSDDLNPGSSAYVFCQC
jgi:hypothetical protein